MFTVLKDLFRFSPSFRYGSLIFIFILVMVILSFFSPYAPDRMRVVPTNRPPSAQYILGTTSTGQDVFWMLTFAVRNTLMVAGLAVLIGRSIGVPLGMISGYLGGGIDRFLSGIVDSIIVIPRLPLLILIASLIRGQVTLFGLGILIGLLDWAFPSKRYRAQVLSLREREFTNTAVFSGMSTWKIVIREHLPFIIPYLLADAVSARDLPSSLEKLEELLDGGEEGLRILVTLHRSLRQVRAAGAMVRARVPRAEVAGAILPPNMQWKLDSLLDCVRRWPDADLRRALGALERADRRLKRGADGATTLVAALAEACGEEGRATSPRRGR